MNIYDLVDSWPAVLAIAGLIMYQLIKTHHGDLKILEKVRPVNPEVHKELIEKFSRRKYNISIICSILFVYAVFVYQKNRPKPLKIENIHLSSSHPDAKGYAVDLDELTIQWDSSGEPEDVDIYMENMDSERRTREFKANSSEGSLKLFVEDYEPLLERRRFKESNRVRIVVRSKNKPFKSKEFDLYVGMEIVAAMANNGTMITAEIDGAIYSYYKFLVVISVNKKNGENYVERLGPITGREFYPNINLQDYNRKGAILMLYLYPDQEDDIKFIRKSIRPSEN